MSCARRLSAACTPISNTSSDGPELLNRIGQNIIVFDFIRPPVMRQIMERKVLTSIQNQVRERWQMQVEFAPEVVDQLMAIHGNDVSSGGRGMGNLAETAVLNPLARTMFELLRQGEMLEGKLLQGDRHRYAARRERVPL